MPSVTVSCGRCGVRHLALDPSERVAELIRFDETRGVGFLEHVCWPDVTYRGVVMAKAMSGVD